MFRGIIAGLGVILLSSSDLSAQIESDLGDLEPAEADLGPARAGGLDDRLGQVEVDLADAPLGEAAG